MTFEEWKKRPVYVAQCKTWAMAATLDLCTVGFRSVPGYRTERDLANRKRVACIMRQQRHQLRSTAFQAS